VIPIISGRQSRARRSRVKAPASEGGRYINFVSCGRRLVLRAEIVDEHDVDEGLVKETEDYGAAVGGDAEGWGAVVGLLFVHGHC